MMILYTNLKKNYFHLHSSHWNAMSRKSNFQDLFAKSYHICKLVELFSGNVTTMKSTSPTKSHELRFALRKRYLLSTCRSLHLSPCLQTVFTLRVSFFRTCTLQNFSIIPCHDLIFRRLCLSFRIRIRCIRPIRNRSFFFTRIHGWNLAREFDGRQVCIKRLIFTRMAGSRASWHNASGNSRTFKSPSRCILTGANHQCTDRCSTPTLVGIEVGVRARTVYYR